MISNEQKREFLFPHDEVRKEQDSILLMANECMENKRNMAIHAPTGIGKTAATLPPALAHVLKHDSEFVLFLTSRNTQHEIVMKTLQKIKDKYGITEGVSIIGKKDMCLKFDEKEIGKNNFYDMCDKTKTKKECVYFENLFDDHSQNGRNASKERMDTSNRMQMQTPIKYLDVLKECKAVELCPYEISMDVAKNSKVVVCDYNYVFNHSIKEKIWGKMNKNMTNAVLLIDEAHNLPDRIRKMASSSLSTLTIKKAISELKKYTKEHEVIDMLEFIQDVFYEKSKKMNKNNYFAEEEIGKSDLVNPIEQKYGFDVVIDQLTEIDEAYSLQNDTLILKNIIHFLESWQAFDTGFARIISIDKNAKNKVTIACKCLDPSIISKDVFSQVKSIIAMSGTFQPLDFYTDILGLENVRQESFKDPFPRENRLNLIIPKTSTVYAKRSMQQWRNIADVLSTIIQNIPGNVQIFFPNYSIKKSVVYCLEPKSAKKIFDEKQGISKKEKDKILENFKSKSGVGAVLTCVSSGNYGEGIDLPGDLLKGVIIVGIPYGFYDTETKATVKYFDEKFNGKGKDYAYNYPTYNRIWQNAGRCIRTETDKGAIIFLGENFSKNMFPKDWEMTISSSNYEEKLKHFFGDS